jgi:hypothetical protein
MAGGAGSIDEQLQRKENYPGQIYMDSMHFGMGCSAL